MITWRQAEARIDSGGTLTRDELQEVISKGGDRTAEASDRMFRACPEWVAEQDARNARRAEAEAAAVADGAALVSDLRARGYHVRWIWDLVNTADPYSDIIPVLVDHLARPYSDGTREGIARALTIPEARGQAGDVIASLLGENGLGHQLRWALANALIVVANPSNRSVIKALIQAERSDDLRRLLQRAFKASART